MRWCCCSRKDGCFRVADGIDISLTIGLEGEIVSVRTVEEDFGFTNVRQDSDDDDCMLLREIIVKET